MKNLLFCPVCGKESLTFINHRKWQCSDCDFVLFHNIAAAVAVILRVGNEIFLTQRAIAPNSGALDLPGGFSDPEETSEETCVRELHEELGIIFPIEKLRYLGSQPNIYPYKGVTYRTMDMFYELILEEKFIPKIDCTEIRCGIWMDLESFPIEKMAFNSQKTFMKSYRKR